MSFVELVALIGLLVSLVSPFVLWFASSKVHAYRLARAEDDIRSLRDWKHDHCEPAVRYISFLRGEREGK